MEDREDLNAFSMGQPMGQPVGQRDKWGNRSVGQEKICPVVVPWLCPLKNGLYSLFISNGTNGTTNLYII